jgi:hypothetical protein
MDVMAKQRLSFRVATAAASGIQNHALRAESILQYLVEQINIYIAE